MIENWLRSRLENVSYGNGQELRADCPFCFARTGREDTKRHLYISAAKPVAYCHRCSWKGHYIGLIMSVEGCTYQEALVYMEKPLISVKGFDKLYSPRGLVQGQVMASQPDGFIGMVDATNSADVSLEQQAIYRYVKKRKVPGYLMEKFGYVLGTHRVWILIDANWWQGRLIIPGEPKYISPPWPIGDSLWNAKALREYKEVTICEGVFSAAAVGPFAAGLCAKTMTNLQAERLAGARRVDTYNILLDAGAEENAHVAADKLRYFGFNGNINIHYMKTGDPAGGIRGGSASWGWETAVRASL